LLITALLPELVETQISVRGVMAQTNVGSYSNPLKKFKFISPTVFKMQC
jgi:hypothetical protein